MFLKLLGRTTLPPDVVVKLGCPLSYGTSDSY
jgi:hypothetical protein